MIAVDLRFSDDIIGMIIVCGGSAYSSSEILGSADGIMNVTYYIIPKPLGPMFGQLSMIENSQILFNAINYTGQIINIAMRSDSDISGTAYELIYRPGDAVGGGDFNAYNHRIENVSEPTDDSDAATKGYVDKSLGSSDISLGITGTTVGQFLKVAEVDTQGKPTKWATDSIANAKGVNF